MSVPDYITRSPTRVLLWKALVAGERFSKHGAAATFGWHLSTADEVLTALHKLGLVHIVGWTRNGDRGPLTKVVAFGPGEDLPAPSKLSNAFVCLRWRERHPKQVKQANQRQSVRRKARKGTLPRGNDPLLMAIMGIPA